MGLVGKLKESCGDYANANPQLNYKLSIGLSIGGSVLRTIRPQPKTTWKSCCARSGMPCHLRQHHGNNVAFDVKHLMVEYNISVLQMNETNSNL